MAVPSTGELNMLNMAREALYGTWGSGTITGPISLYDLVNGGNTNGSGNSYPTINDGCEPNPASRSNYTSLLQIYKVDDGTVTGPFTFYVAASEAATATAVATGDTIYTDAELTTTLGAFGNGTGSTSTEYYSQSGLGTTLSDDQLMCPPIGNTIYETRFNTNSSGEIAKACHAIIL